tara:strand:+ start:929 stop:1984 length:1056 start_codon:yes stop_codon:yes gene_type:complete
MVVFTTLTEFLANDASASDLISDISFSKSRYNPPNINDNSGIYNIFINANSNFLSVLDGGDTYHPFDQNTYGEHRDLSNGQIVTNNVICKRVGDVLVDKYRDFDTYGVDKIRFAGGDPSLNTEGYLGVTTVQSRYEEIFGNNDATNIRGMAKAYSHSPGIGIRLKRNDYWDNSFNTQGFSVHGDSSDNTIYSDGGGYTYFDFSSNFIIGPLENDNQIQSYMHSHFYDSEVKFIHHPTKNTIGGMEKINESVKYKTTSDERLKTKINHLTPQEGLELCLKLRPVRFNWKTKINKQKEIGLIAQEVYKILDETYDENIEKTQMIDYSFFNPIIISAVQCIQTRIENLKHIINK